MSIAVPRLVAVLPPPWIRVRTAGGPLTWWKGSDDSLGSLQASIPSNADALGLDPDLPSRAAELGVRLGTPKNLHGGSCEFGRYGAADILSDDFRHVRIWVLVSEKSDVALFTWISNEMDAGEAERIVFGIRPAEEIPDALRSTVLNSVRSNFRNDGCIVPAAMILGSGVMKMVPIELESETELPEFAELVRQQAAKSKAALVAIVASATFRGADDSESEGVAVHLETPTARQSYLLPIANAHRLRELGEPVEVDPDLDEGALRDFFPS